MMKPNAQSAGGQSSPHLALLACRVFEREIALHAVGAAHILETRFFEVGLHGHPDQLRVVLQAELRSMETRDDIEAVALAYGLCGRGTSGLQPARHQLVIPRAHDCITVFMSGKEIYTEHQRRCPTCYYYTPRWNRERRVPGLNRLASMKVELEKKRFDQNNVELPNRLVRAKSPSRQIERHPLNLLHRRKLEADFRFSRGLAATIRSRSSRFTDQLFVGRFHRHSDDSDA